MKKRFTTVVKEKEKTIPDSESTTKLPKSLILINDDVNTFDHVIETLIEICNHNEEQAEQCALITHLKGKCPIRKGERNELLHIKQQLSDRMLSTVISE
ncbi:MAG: ATP-dependent Clp protease adaptor ClpS [Bacteroidales bacterium]|nr:ATP-dependent Clp protease adaptor ClpS [Bacteroidales bacterium]